MKILKTTLVLTLIGIICGILIGVSNEITAPVIAKNKAKAELVAYSALFPGLDSADVITVDLQGTIYEVREVKKAGSVAGYLYKGKQTNSYGVVDILVGIDKDGRFTGIEFLNLDQTASMKPAIETNARYYKGKLVTEINLNDLIGFSSGTNPYDSATGSSFGSTSMRTVIKDAIAVFSGSKPVVVDHYKDIYGVEVVKTEEAITKDKVTKKEMIKDSEGTLLGYAYTLSSVKNTGTAVDYNEDKDWGMTLLVGLDENNVIVGIIVTNTDHTAGFYKKHNAYLTGLIGTNIAAYEDVANTIAGASFSRGHMLELLEALKGALA